MRVAFIKRKSRPAGGGERYLTALLAALAPRGWELTVIGERWDQLPPGAAFVELAVGGRGRLGYLGFARAVARHLQQASYDAVVSLDRTVGQDIYRAGEGIHREWLDRRRRFERSPAAWWSRLSPMQRRLLARERACLESSRWIAVNSQMVGRDVARHFPRLAGRVRLVRNGVDLDRFRPAAGWHEAQQIRRGLGLPPDAPLLAFVGSGFRRKGLQAVLSLVQVLPQIHTAVLGADRWQPWQQRAVAFGVAERVHPIAAGTPVEQLLRAAELFVLPTLFDPCSNATLEALACGLPVVTTVFNGAAELIARPVQGVALARPDDGRGLQLAVRELLPTALALREDAAGRAEVREAVAELAATGAAARMAELIEEAARARRDSVRPGGSPLAG